MSQAPASAQGSDQIYSVAESEEVTPGADEVSTSWRRSLREHKVDPDSRQAPRILTARELMEAREPVEELISTAQQENDRLHAIVGKVGYVVLLTSSNGVVVDVRGDPARSDEFAYWGVWKGGVWSENVEGTNGIGTCIAEQRPITVHRTQHFRARNGSLSCCGAPVFGPDGNLAAVLDVSSIDPELSDRSHSLALAVTIDSARAIEESLFRVRFQRAWNLAVAVPSADGRTLLLAVDSDQRIVGADRNARSTLGLDDRLLASGLSLWTYFDKSSSLFRARNDDMTDRLTRIGDSQPWRALITPPERSITNTRLALLHARPRIRQMDHLLGKATGLSDEELATAALSPRERSIIELIGQGRSNKEIARLLGISPETVKSHVKNMFSKLGVERRAQAIYRAQNLGLVTTL